MKRLLLLTSLCFIASTMSVAENAPQRDILKACLECPGVASSFKASDDWFPYPDYRDRAGWKALFGADSAAVVDRGVKLLDYKWQYIPASAYLAFERTGDRAAMENIERGNRNAYNVFLFAELAEGKGRFIDQLIDGAYLAAQQPSWVLSAHQPRQKSGRSLPDAREQLIDLASGRTGAALSLIYHFFHEEFDKVDPSISYALKESIKRNILDCFLDDEVKGNWWMAKDVTPTKMFNNWTPWCTADVMLSFFLMEKDQARLERAVRLSVEAMDAFLNYIKSDGACEEGPGYWGAAAGKTYNYLQLMYDASRGAFDMFSSGRIRSFGEYISRSYVGGGYVINFADASAKMDSGTQLVYSYGKALRSREMQDFALYLTADTKKEKFVCPAPDGSDTYRYMECFRFQGGMRQAVDSLNRLAEKKGFEPVRQGLRLSVPTSTWYPQTQMCFMRNSSRWFLGTKGGFNDESHNHNDIGCCVLYVRDIPVLVDAGVGTYTKATFNNDLRYGIWTMQGWWHNLPQPNGIDQKFGRNYVAGPINFNERKGVFSIELAPAYPDSACVKSLIREYNFSQSKAHPGLSVIDRITLSKRTAPDEIHFLVKGEVQQGTPGELFILVEGLRFRMTYPSDMSLAVDEKKLDDRKLSSVWGDSLRLIRLISKADAPLQNEYYIRIEEE